jgi:phage shock protein A
MIYGGIKIPEKAKESLARMCLERLIDRFYRESREIQEMMKELEHLQRRYKWLISQGDNEGARKLKNRIEQLQEEIAEEEVKFIQDLIKKLT